MAYSKKKNSKKNFPSLNEATRKEIDDILQSFRENDSLEEYEFPSHYTTEERAYIHKRVQSMGGMESKSFGKANIRRLVLKKLTSVRKKEVTSFLKLHQFTLESSAKLLQDLPLSSVERQDVSPLIKTYIGNDGNNQLHADVISSYTPVIPPQPGSSSLLTERTKLPTWVQREQILDIISKNQVVMITGDTGSGKTTQVPQYIMELFSQRQEPVRIVCTQPRRIAAMSVAERVATERGERIGGPVGYQIRLESRLSASTALVFCTTGILLRTLMYCDDNLDKVTHLIIDEVHERDRFVDFLLGVLKSRISRYPKLRIILMSAALDVSVFSGYFGKCPVLHVQGKCYPVKEYFLEDALQLTNYGNICDKASQHDFGTRPNGQLNCYQTNVTQFHSTFDKWIQEFFVDGSEKTLAAMSESIASNIMPVNYQHSVTRLTPLMVAAGRGRKDVVTRFLMSGADPTIKAGECTAADLARMLNHQKLAELLEMQCKAFVQQAATRASEALQKYKERWDEEIINVQLIMDILHWIFQQDGDGAVLIFLSGYQEIMDIRQQIMYLDSRFSNSDKSFEVFTLHSCMQSSDQRRVFSRLPKGTRKIVLSTNLAETSITIDDIVYVIDTGKVKVKSFDSLTGVSSLKSEWVPQASAIQRKGRAGRCQDGVCFHLFSRPKFETFEKYQIPEIFRVALDELCLQSKTLAPPGFSIVEFISLVPEAPTPMAVKRAVDMLKLMDALDPWENVTDLGRLLLELPVDPRLGKMLLTATILRCLDPVLTIVCSLSQRTPFLLPSESEEKKEAAARKLELAAGTLSDHMVMLRAFSLWQAAKSRGKGYEFCRQYYLSSSTLETVHQLRVQIQNQLRKSGFMRSLEELSTNSNSWVAIKASILSGLYPQVGRAFSSGKISTLREPAVKLHTSSALFGGKSESNNGSQKNVISNFPTKWLIYEQISRSGGLVASINLCTLVTPIVLAIFGGHCRLPTDCIKECAPNKYDNYSDESDCMDDSDSSDDDDNWSDISDECVLGELSEGLEDFALAESFSSNKLERLSKSKRTPKSVAPKTSRMVEFHLDEWIRFRMDRNSANQLFALRQKWQALVARRLRDPVAPDIAGDKQLLDTLLEVLAKEELESGLPPSPDYVNPRLGHFDRNGSNNRPVGEGHRPKFNQHSNWRGNNTNVERAQRPKAANNWRMEPRSQPENGSGRLTLKAFGNNGLAHNFGNGFTGPAQVPNMHHDYANVVPHAKGRNDRTPPTRTRKGKFSPLVHNSGSSLQATAPNFGNELTESTSVPNIQRSEHNNGRATNWVSYQSFAPSAINLHEGARKMDHFHRPNHAQNKLRNNDHQTQNHQQHLRDAVANGKNFAQQQLPLKNEKFADVNVPAPKTRGTDVQHVEGSALQVGDIVNGQQQPVKKQRWRRQKRTTAGNSSNC